jgi:predicted DNA-binding transcriptional regulator AlpA
MAPNMEFNNTRIERLPEVLARIGMGRSWPYYSIKVGTFPRPVT